MSNQPLYNPYDFANPVTNINLLAGRSSERHEIEYYLGHAEHAPRPINIALIGPRASGKTSLLNFTENAAKRHNFFTVRINLDSGIASNQFSFFYAILDSLITTACVEGYFGGVGSRIYDTYLDLVIKHEVPQSPDFCRFLFSVRYAKSRQTNDHTNDVPNNVVQHDFDIIRREIKKPIILIFDECNVLIHSRELLQKLRNIFMNLPGYMLAFAGTEDLFPLMDEIFSPIIRQFKKINVREFIDRNDTRECILRPLESLPGNPDQYFDFSPVIIREIHDLTGGRPYEIQLLCHAMFRRIQDRSSKKMSLGTAVLDDIRRELASTQNLADRSVSKEVPALASRDLLALNVLGRSCGYATFDDIWRLEFLRHGYDRWAREELYNRYELLCKRGILKEESGKIIFSGDDFDRIYIKYLTSRDNQRVVIDNMPLDVGVMFLIRSIFRDIESSFIQINGINKETTDLGAFFRDAASTDSLSEAPPWITGIYMDLIRHRHEQAFCVNRICIDHPWGSTTVLSDTTSDVVFERLEQLGERLKLLGGNLHIESQNINAISVDKLLKIVRCTKNEELKGNVARAHVHQMYEQYLNNNNIDEALFHARLASELKSCLDPVDKNNIGYVALANGEHELAKDLFSESLELDAELLLARYNMGMVRAKEGDLSGAIDELTKCLMAAREQTKSNLGASCLFVPTLRGEFLEIKEVRGALNIQTMAQEAIRLLQEIQLKAPVAAH